MSEVIRVAMLALLGKLEWSGQGKRYDDNSYQAVCPVCRRPESAYDGCDAYHNDDCELLALLRALEPDK